MLRIGIDIGSTTAKIVAIDEEDTLVYSNYARHHAKAQETLVDFLGRLASLPGVGDDARVSVCITGSIGMGVAEKCGLSFVQEVVAASKAIQRQYPQTACMIDIGGEDAKVVFFRQGEPVDLRMNGNCAGGTGAFIDQMALILGVDINELNRLALSAERVYPIASRCGVFCKTDIQNLVARNVSREDIAASIFHAVAVQTVVTLAHGCDIGTPLLLCGGPLTFIPALRKAFVDYLSLDEAQLLLPAQGALLPAYGAALADVLQEKSLSLCDVMRLVARLGEAGGGKPSGLQPLFASADAYAVWKKRMDVSQVMTAPLEPGDHDVYLGIDSGSTTTKIVLLDQDKRLVYSYYKANEGNPIGAVEEGLQELSGRCAACGARLHVKGSCSTGYGEDLIRAAFQLDCGIVETMAHYMAARYLNKEVSFILDIGGQDMKAIFVNAEGVIDRIEINEACSSGCGSFIETFAKTLGYAVGAFAAEACHAQAPCDLGTRCTVFMNSKVKQVLRDGATVGNIAAGLAYSVVKNCLYKVLKLHDTAVLGRHIVLQGGTMRNDAVARAIEVLTGAEVTRCDIPELMGAYGCALYAESVGNVSAVELDELRGKARYITRQQHCKGCDNQCLVVRYDFGTGKHYYSGNRCEKVFTNGDGARRRGESAYQAKLELLFNRQGDVEHPQQTIGIPRCLNMYEDYPFWHTLFTECGVGVVLSDTSRFADYERQARMVMSDNICFPAKLVHSHIENLKQKAVDRIFMPFVLFERPDKAQNSYNCPIVTGYSEVVKSVQQDGVPIDAPTISFRDKAMLFEQIVDYLATLHIENRSLIRRAFRKALTVQDAYVDSLVDVNRRILQQAGNRKELVVMLAGRPYHADPLVQHKVADMLADMGINVVTDDLVRKTDIDLTDVHFLSQWAYPDRILKAAKWCAMQGAEVQFVQLTSFGCGPDAFLTDEVRDVLMRHGKSLTLLKLDDINNVGSMKLRVRSLVESLRMAGAGGIGRPVVSKPFVTVPVYTKACRKRKMLVPFFTPFLSPLIPSIMQVAGYEVETLPLSNQESCEWGLKYANNEVCYPATLIVGDIVKAFKSGRYDPNETVVAMTQTGGQCRASNYLSLIKKALVDAGYAQVPVVAFSLGSMIENRQPGFKINWLKILPIALRAILYSDCIAKFYYASVVRETESGRAASLRDKYLNKAAHLIRNSQSEGLFGCLQEAADDFNRICRGMELPKVGVVGEIFLKFNPFAQHNIIDWLIGQGIEVAPPVMADFFLQAFVNRKVKQQAYLLKPGITSFVYDQAYKLVEKQLEQVNKIGSVFRYFTPFNDIFDEAAEGQRVINLNAQFGEGWLLPAEVMSYAAHGITNVVSLQPFGCIANHIVAKGVEKRIKSYFPDLRLLSLDFDSGVSDVNVTNRLLLFIDNLKGEHREEPAAQVVRAH